MGHFHPPDKLLLHGGLIPGAVKMAGVWLLPKRRRSQLMDEQDKGGRIENDATL